MPRPPKTERNAEIIRLFSAGLSQAEVGREVGIGRGGVSRAIGRYRAAGGVIVRAATPSSHPRQAQKRLDALPKRAAAGQGRPPATRSSDAQLVADFIAQRGVTRCPARALVATQACLTAP